MAVLAIDPGNIQSAYVVMEESKIFNHGILPNDFLLSKDFIASLSNGASFQINEVLIEMVACYGMPVGAEVFDTCVWIGRYLERAKALGLETQLIYRKEVKLWHCNSMRANDSSIRQALIDKYGAPGTKKLPGATYGIKKDEWSALAIASYWNESNLQIQIKNAA